MDSAAQQPQRLDLAAVCFACFHGVDSRGVDAGVPQQIREARHIFMCGIMRHGEQMPQIVRKNFFFGNARRRAELFHFRPDIAAIQRRPASRNENTAAVDMLLPHILLEGAA